MTCTSCGADTYRERVRPTLTAQLHARVRDGRLTLEQACEEYARLIVHPAKRRPRP